MSKKINTKKSDERTKKILEGVDKVEPKSKNYFALKSFLLGLSIALFFVVSIYAVAAFLFDFYEILEISDTTGDFSAKLFGELLFEFLLIGALGGVLIYFVYRETDWILVKYKGVVAIITLGIIVLGGVILFLIYEKDEDSILYDTREGAGKFLPYRKDRDKRILNYFEDKNIFIGMIVEVKLGANGIESIVVNNIKESKTFLVDSNTKLPKFEYLKRGKKITVKFEKTGDKLVARFIKPIDIGREFMKDKLPNPEEVKGIRARIMDGTELQK